MTPQEIADFCQELDDNGTVKPMQVVILLKALAEYVRDNV